MRILGPPGQPLVLYDLVFATRRSRLTGIERYAINMFCASARRQEGVLALVADASLLPPDMPVIEVGGFPKGWLSVRWNLSSEQLQSAVMVCASTPASPSLLLSRMPIARIIHDDFAWSRSETLSRSGRLLFRDYETVMLKRHDLLFAPTAIARDELSATLGRTDIAVAGNAPGVNPLGPQKKPERLGEVVDFILMVGTVEPRKNYEQAARIIAKGLDKDIHFVIAGRHGWLGSGEVLQAAAASGRLTWLQDAGDDELRWLYQNCRKFLSLSHAEGFNMPLVEAGIAGCPILCTDLPIHRAVAPPWTHFLPPGADDGHVAQLLRQPSVRCNNSVEYCNRFSWDSIAETVETPLKVMWQERTQ